MYSLVLSYDSSKVSVKCLFLFFLLFLHWLMVLRPPDDQQSQIMPLEQSSVEYPLVEPGFLQRMLHGVNTHLGTQPMLCPPFYLHQSDERLPPRRFWDLICPTVIALPLISWRGGGNINIIIVCTLILNEHKTGDIVFNRVNDTGHKAPNITCIDI